MGVSNLSFLEGILEVPGKSQPERNICGQNRCLIYTGCPKSSFLFFISLYFSTIRLGKQIIEKKFVFQSNSPFSYLLCYFLIGIFDLCNSAPKVFVREYIFQPHMFCILWPKLLERLPCFLWMSRKINTLNAKTFSYFRGMSLYISIYWLICRRNC